MCVYLIFFYIVFLFPQVDSAEVVMKGVNLIVMWSGQTYTFLILRSVEMGVAYCVLLRYTNPTKVKSKVTGNSILRIYGNLVQGQY